jgi:hypothetical protein
MNVNGIGQTGTSYAPQASSGSAGLAAVAKPSAKDEFLKWAQMTPGERMRANMLSSMGLDEAKLAAMSEEEREKIEAQIREMIEVKVRADVENGKTGVMVDQKV